MAQTEPTQYAERGTEQAREAMMAGWEQAQEMVSQRPLASVAVGFGLGFGTGILLAAAFGQAPIRRENTMEQIGRSVLESMQRILPQSMTEWSK